MRCFILCAVIVLSVSSAWAEVRTWSSASGKFSVQAELIEVVDGKARLRKEDGRVIAVPIAKLSSADRRLLMAQKNGATDASTPPASVKVSDGLRISAKAQWESPPPPLVVEISILGKPAAEAKSYGRLKLTKATTADGVDMKQKRAAGPDEAYVKINRNDNVVSFSPKQPKTMTSTSLIPFFGN